MKTYLDYWYSIEGISQIMEIFEKEKHDIRFIGGCVRDALLGNKNSDIDFAINCKPETTAKLLNKNKIKILDYGKKYGTITALIGKKNFEITSLREDKNQTGRYTEVNFTDDWTKDALRRDFTFNAINVNSFGKMEDYFNGKIDLSFQQVKFIGDIEIRIKEDYLRILRYFRFLGLFENPKIIEGYEESINKNIPNLRKHVSNDRIRNELLKMIKNKFKMNSITSLDNFKNQNIFIKQIKHWWTEDQYDLGLNRCMNIIDALFFENEN